MTTDGILVRDGYSTVTKTRILGGARHSIKQQIVRFDIEEQRELSEEERLAFGKQLKMAGRERHGSRYSATTDMEPCSPASCSRFEAR